MATPIGPMPGPPPPWGMQKVLCRLRWQTSAPMSPGLVQADLGVHVGAVHVDLPAVAVDDLADLLHVFLEHAMRGGVGDHQGGEIVLVLLGLGFQVCDFDVAVRIAATGTTFNPATTALAGLVPCAETGIRQTLRCASPRDSW